MGMGIIPWFLTLAIWIAGIALVMWLVGTMRAITHAIETISRDVRRIADAVEADRVHPPPLKSI